MSYLDVFRDFEYEDEHEELSLERSAFEDAFSQLLNEPSSQSSQLSTHLESTKATKPTETQPASQKATLQDYEEAFTVLKSIEDAHSPFNYTAINAYLHYQRGLNTNKRSVEGVVWPEHPESFQCSHLLTDKSTDKEPACLFSQNQQLQAALSKACQSIWRQKSSSSSHLDPLLSDSITQRTAFLLQTLLDRIVLNRKSAIKVLKAFTSHNAHVDVDNVPADWKSTREAAKQLIGQAALDQDIYESFNNRLNAIFSPPTNTNKQL